jgi:hypothetical protein
MVLHLLRFSPAEQVHLRALVDTSSTTAEVKNKLVEECYAKSWMEQLSSLYFLTEADIRVYELSWGIMRGQPVNASDMIALLEPSYSKR